MEGEEAYYLESESLIEIICINACISALLSTPYVLILCSLRNLISLQTYNCTEVELEEESDDDFDYGEVAVDR